MALAPPAHWSDLARQTLACYDEALLRQVAGRLIRPRNQWPVEDLIVRMADTLDNPAVIDRRLKELAPAGRQALALIGHSRQPRWALGNLVEMLMALGHADGLAPLFDLLTAGLLFPVVAAPARVRTFEQWLAHPGAGGLAVFAPPQIAARAVGEDLWACEGEVSPTRERGSDDSVSPTRERGSVPDPSLARRANEGQEADGLEWLLRLGVLWQQVSAAPLRRTQQGGFFKRDLERLEKDPLLNGPPADRLADVPDLGFLAAALAELEGVLREADGELRAGSLPAAWDGGLSAALESLWADLPHVRAWGPLDGWRDGETAGGNPFASAYLLALLWLARLPDGAWAAVESVEDWLRERHPYWATEAPRPSRKRPWLEVFLLGVAYHLRLVQATRQADGTALVRLAPMGRWLLGLAEAPPAEAVYARTLLVQPNLEIVAYRQGLSAGLVGKLTRFAAWNTLGAACTLQLGPETVYRALETGESYESIRLALDQHGTRATPPAVLDLLRTWANKRDRITVYPAATLLEFASAADLHEALARGLPAVPVAETLAVVASEEEVDFRHFRLAGTRDYTLPPERCVTVEADGVTLAVDLARSDLLLETELPRFAELLDGPSANGRRQYRLTPTSLAAGRSAGLGVTALEAWFQQRAGQPLPPAARLLLTGPQTPPVPVSRQLVLQVHSEEQADGLLQWPETRPLIDDRLGPTALVVSEERLPLLRERMRAAGIVLEEAASNAASGRPGAGDR
jgi:hypothetical protein